MNRTICPLDSSISFENGLEAVFEFAAILCARQHRTKIERHDALVAQNFRHVAGDDSLRKSFDDGRLADARFANQHRIVLRAARENLHYAANLLVAADHGIELPAARLFRKVASVALQRLVLCFGILIGHTLISAHCGERLEHRVVGGACMGEDRLRGIALLFRQSRATGARSKRTRL